MELEYQIQRTISTEHRLVVEDQVFVEKKESVAGMKSEDFQDVGVCEVSHTRQIGDEKFYTIHQIMDKDGNMTDRTIDTNLEEEDFDKFNAEWESGWNPVLKTDPSLVLTESSSSDGFLTSLKNSLTFW